MAVVVLDKICKTYGNSYHVHLMVADSIILSQIEQFADAGSDLISLHAQLALCLFPRQWCRQRR